MKPLLPDKVRVFAIDPCPRGFGYVVLEGKEALVDWGLKIPGSTPVDKNAWCLTQMERLIARVRPEVIVLENTAVKGSRRYLRVKKLIQQMLALASRRKLRTCKISRLEMRQVFAISGASTKHQMACTIAERFPEIAPRLPRPRKLWVGEAARMSIFNAAALAITYFRE